MADEESLFNLPTVPEEFGVVLPPANLRRLNFSALDFETMRRASIEYIKTYFPEQFNDFVANNGIIMLLELFAYMAGNLSQRSDILVEESFLPTSRTEDAVTNHLALINQTIRRASPAVVDVNIEIPSELPTALNVEPATKFSSTGADGDPIVYEIFRAPGDFTSKITIPPGKRGVVAFGIEGSFAAPVTAISAGGNDQVIEILGEDILDQPFIVTVTTGDDVVTWQRVQNIEKSMPNDEVYEVRLFSDRARIIFGNNIAGKAPLAGQVVTVRYRTGGGIRGRIGSNVINETRPISPSPPASAPVEVLFRNVSPSSGGQDAETLETAKRRAPKEAATLGSAVSGEDYAQRASTFSHPVFGSVLKAVAGFKQGIELDQESLARAIRQAPTLTKAVEILDANFVNRNVVELFVLAEGPDNTPVTPSVGLRRGLETFFDRINVLTDEVRVLPGAIKPINLDAVVVISRGSDGALIKENVNNIVDEFFNIDNFDMGEPLRLGPLYETIQSVPGVQFVNIFEPSDDIIATGKLADPNASGVGINELITLGSKKIDFFAGKGNNG